MAAGSLGELPAPAGQELTAPVLIKGQLSDPAEFAGILLRAGADGSSVTLGDVARIEVGSQSYNFGTRLDGQPSVAVGVQLAPTANALATATAVRAKLAELSQYFPPGMKYDIPYDTAPFVKISITQVIHTLLEAMALVFAVMYLFLQKLRYTLIPTLVVPVALLGTCAVLLALGYSINVLTLFGMVLAIGILVDDAIVVVENVERIMATEGLATPSRPPQALAAMPRPLVLHPPAPPRHLPP
ncbi:acriflavine resistance protein B, partial [Pseudomonas oryzihabitans]